MTKQGQSEKSTDHTGLLISLTGSDAGSKLIALYERRRLFSRVWQAQKVQLTPITQVFWTAGAPYAADFFTTVNTTVLLNPLPVKSVDTQGPL